MKSAATATCTAASGGSHPRNFAPIRAALARRLKTPAEGPCSVTALPVSRSSNGPRGRSISWRRKVSSTTRASSRFITTSTASPTLPDSRSAGRTAKGIASTKFHRPPCAWVGGTYPPPEARICASCPSGTRAGRFEVRAGRAVPCGGFTGRSGSRRRKANSWSCGSRTGIWFRSA